MELAVEELKLEDGGGARTGSRQELEGKAGGARASRSAAQGRELEGGRP
jgi:hypothetical protein